MIQPIISNSIAKELKINISQVNQTISLLDSGSTVPFIARYRKEATGGLNDTQLRQLEERLRYLRELYERKEQILNSIQKQDKLTETLKQQILETETKTELEDLYLPYKPKRRNRAQTAREAGLEPLADLLFNNLQLHPNEEAKNYINESLGINSINEALEGARFILIERFSEQATLLNTLRHYLWDNGLLISRKIDNDTNIETVSQKFKDYFQYQEPLKNIPSHRALAILRGKKLGVLQVDIILADANTSESEDDFTASVCQGLISDHINFISDNNPGDHWLQQVIEWTWKVRLAPMLKTDLILQLRENAEKVAIGVFSDNLRDLLMAAPAGAKTIMGLDPGIRTGVKVAIIDSTGKLLDHTTIFPHAPQNKWQESLCTLAKLCLAYHVELIGIGNGTASRETVKIVADLMKNYPSLNLTKVLVNEAGASVYSASELAAKEFPDLDVSFRGAVSIARRLQDPMAELVKIEPKSIGVGQYQHDVNQLELERSLNAVVEDCVNAVGVDVNLASATLLAKISGLGESLAKNIVEYRNQNGKIASREHLKKIPRFGDKAFELSAGFLKINNGDNPIDCSAVHPESYEIVHNIVNKIGKSINEIIGNETLLATLKPEQFINDQFGLPTIKDIIQELKKPGRDPRPFFQAIQFKDGVETIHDLKPNMEINGVITNVTNFGAFVDIGVHQDGLVHISAIANQFIKDPREVIKAGENVKVKVLEVDVVRNRITLTMRLNENAHQTKELNHNKQQENKSSSSRKNNNQLLKPNNKKQNHVTKSKNSTTSNQSYTAVNSFADFFANAKTLKTK